MDCKQTKNKRSFNILKKKNDTKKEYSIIISFKEIEK